MATKYRADANKRQPSEYKAKEHKGAKAGGEWQAAFVPVRQVNAAKILREISSRAKRERPQLPKI
jgi:hypothetical protein